MLEGYPYWSDEAFSVAAAGRPFGEALRFYLLPDIHPPGHYLLLSVWVRLFDSGEVAVRSLSFIGAVGTLAAIWWLGRGGFSPLALASAAAWIASHWAWVFYAQEARAYALTMAGVVWLSLAFARLWSAAQPPDRKALGLFALGALLLSSLHYYAMALACSALLLLCWKARRDPKSLWPPFAVCCACAAWAAFNSISREVVLPTTGLLSSFGQHIELLVFPQLHADGVLWGKSAAISYAFALVFLAFPVARALAWWRRGRAPRRLPRQPLSNRFWEQEAAFLRSQFVLIGAFLLVLASINTVTGVFVSKGFFILLPLLALALGIAIRRLWSGIPQLVILVLLLGSSILVTWEWQGAERGHHWKRYPHLDRKGMGEWQSALGPETPRYCFRCEYPLAEAKRSLLDLYLRESARPVIAVLERDLRHLVPPYVVVTAIPSNWDEFQGLLRSVQGRGLQFAPLGGPLRENRVATVYVYSPQSGEAPEKPRSAPGGTVGA